jgi:hypothetical protein
MGCFEWNRQLKYSWRNSTHATSSLQSLARLVVLLCEDRNRQARRPKRQGKLTGLSPWLGRDNKLRTAATLLQAQSNWLDTIEL